MLDLQRQQRVRVENVESVTVECSENYATILRNHQPQTGLAAKFSVEFALAAAINPGAAMAHWSDIRLRDGTALQTERVHRARGHADLPLTEADLFAKFEDCLHAGYSALAPSVLFERLQSMQQAPARALIALH